MATFMGVYIVVPAYNEESVLPEVIKELKSHNYKNIIVVDDGSNDNTFLSARSEGVQVLRHIVNRGQGAALKTGVDFALQQGAQVIVTFDSDGQHRPQDISTLINALRDNHLDIVIGSRFLSKRSNVPGFRKVILKGGVLILRLLYGVSLSDAHNGLRAFTAGCAKRLNLVSDRMEHASEFIEEIARLNLRFKEVPISVRYSDYSKSKGQSSLNAFNILFKMLVKKLLR